MNDRLLVFEQVVRRVQRLQAAIPLEQRGDTHPLTERNVHPLLVPIVKKLFDDGHFAQATFEALKFIEKRVQEWTQSTDTGRKLMSRAFLGDKPALQLTRMETVSEKDEQEGYGFLFVGAVLAIRNPRGHEVSLTDDESTCLDHLTLASMLLRRMERAGYALFVG